MQAMGFVSKFERVARDLVIGIVVGVLSGAGSFAFLKSLEWATETRLDNGWLLWLLPVAGFAIGLTYKHLGGESSKGTNLILDEWHDPTDLGPPKRMAPLVLVGATVTHLFGGSGGREGAAVQIAASLTSIFRRWIKPEDRRAVMIAAIAGGFGSVFGVPAGGTVFALEVPTVGRARYDHIVAALAASFVGDRVAQELGIHHTLPKAVTLHVNGVVALKLLAAAIAFGVCAAAFVEGTHLIKRFLALRISYAPLRPALGGAGVVALTGIIGTRAYLGLSLPLIDAALAGFAIGSAAFAWKLLFTSVTIGSGFPGGEVTPLFCMGACLGSVLAGPLNMPSSTLAAIGMVAVFAAASNTPVACALVGIELFGGGAAFAFLLVTVVATAVSGDRSVYARQRIARSVRGATLAAGHDTMSAAETSRIEAFHNRFRRR